MDVRVDANQRETSPPWLSPRHSCNHAPVDRTGASLRRICSPEALAATEPTVPAGKRLRQHRPAVASESFGDDPLVQNRAHRRRGARSHSREPDRRLVQAGLIPVAREAAQEHARACGDPASTSNSSDDLKSKFDVVAHGAIQQSRDPRPDRCCHGVVDLYDARWR
jgi:hypothetical protein